MEQQNYDYVELEEHKILYDQIELHIDESNGKKFVTLNDEISAYIRAHKLNYYKLKIGEDDGALVMEFVENADTKTAAVKHRTNENQPDMLASQAFFDTIYNLIGKPDVCTKVNISDNLTPWVAPVPVTKTVEATSEETVTEGIILTFDADELLGQKFKVNNTLIDARAKLVTKDEEDVETTTALVLGENEIDLTDEDIASYTLTLFNESGYEVEYTYTPAPDPCVATYQILYEEDQHI